MGHLVFSLLLRGIFIALRPFTGAWHALQDRFRGIGTYDWPTTSGVVFICDVSQRDNMWLADLTYSYSAKGEYWSGKMRRHFALESDADGYAALHPKESAVVVRYRPDQPGKSVVLAADQKMASAAGSI